MKITFLGTAGSTISKDRGYPAILINDDLLLDCGEGTTQKLLQVNAIDSIKTIFLTHLHNDHLLGLFSLLWYYWIGNRKEELEIIGPVGMEKTIKSILKLINTPEAMMTSLQPKYRELQSMEEVQILQANYTIKYVDVDHRIPALACRIESNGKSVCYSGDTRPTNALISLADNCDLFICETTMPDNWSVFAHEHYHCTPSDAAKLGMNARCKKLVLFHIPSHFTNQMDKFRKQAEKIYKKDVIIAEDMMKLEI
ncbi:MAG: MBL fold metallo-hydrolase [Promethearchaeota archaeon]